MAAATDTRSTVLEAALEVFSHDGVHAARLEDVATAAGVTRATLYYHFHGKDELVAALLGRAVDRLAEAVEAALGEAPLDELVAAILRVYAEDQRLYRLLFTELWGPVPTAEVFEDIESRVLAPITDRIAAAVVTGEVREVDPRITALALFGQASAVALGRIVREEPLDVESLTDEVAALVRVGLAPEN